MQSPATFCSKKSSFLVLFYRQLRKNQVAQPMVAPSSVGFSGLEFPIVKHSFCMSASLCTEKAAQEMPIVCIVNEKAAVCTGI